MSDLQHKKRTLRKIKLNNNGGATLEWKDTYFNPQDAGYVETTETRTSEALVHDDLRAAMKPFDEHWAIFGEQVPEPKANHAFDGTLKGLERITVTSVTLSGGDEDEGGDEKPLGVHIQGTRRLKCGRVINFCTPGIKLGSPQEKYKFATQVDEHLQALEAEAWAYLEGKHAPPAQTAMNFEGQEGDGQDVKLIGVGEVAE